MKRLGTVTFLLAMAWLVFAVFEFGPSDVIGHYYALPLASASDSRLPAELANRSARYRVERDFVVENFAGSVRKYSDCVIFDLENWRCQFDDKSGVFGYREGRWFNISTPAGQLPTSVLTDLGTRQISRFQFVVLSCRWALADGTVNGLLTCLVGPFFE